MDLEGCLDAKNASSERKARSTRCAPLTSNRCDWNELETSSMMILFASTQIRRISLGRAWKVSSYPDPSCIVVVRGSCNSCNPRQLTGRYSAARRPVGPMPSRGMQTLDCSRSASIFRGSTCRQLSWFCGSDAVADISACKDARTEDGLDNRTPTTPAASRILAFGRQLCNRSVEGLAGPVFSGVRGVFLVTVLFAFLSFLVSDMQQAQNGEGL